MNMRTFDRVWYFTTLGSFLLLAIIVFGFILSLCASVMIIEIYMYYSDEWGTEECRFMECNVVLQLEGV